MSLITKFLGVFIFVLPIRTQLPLPSLPYLPSNVSTGPSSPPLSPNSSWSSLLGNLLYFYDAQRSGKLPSTNRVYWRNDSALDDGQDAGVDLSGGYYDAGDYLKCTFPLSFTLMSVCWGAMDFGGGYDSANQTAYLDSMLRWGLDWLIKAHPQPRTLFVQVAACTDIDNNNWGGDRDIASPRPSFVVNDTSPGTDAAAQAAAAFAACSLLYANYSITSTNAPASLFNASYSQILRIHAEQLYDFAMNATGGRHTYQTSVPEVAKTYPSTSYGDELTIAALFLALGNTTTDSDITPTVLYKQALEHWSTYTLANKNGILNWDNKTPALAVLFAQIAETRPDLQGYSVATWKSEAERYFDNIISNNGPGVLTKGGLLWYDGDSDEASLNPALNAAMLMVHYAPLSPDPNKRAVYLNQVDYTLGKNPMSVSYVVGSNSNSPSNPHSAPASGGNDISRINTVPPQEAYILYGGVVGGPTKEDLFYDIRDDWVETEVALDYVAPMLSLAAYNVLTNPHDPYYVFLQPGEYAERKPRGQPCDAALPCRSRFSDGAKIAIGVTVGTIGLIAAAFLLKWFWMRLKLNR